MLVLEAWIVTFGEGLVSNARFGSLDCHFCESLVVTFGDSLVENARFKMLVLEAWIVTFGENRFW